MNGEREDEIVGNTGSVQHTVEFRMRESGAVIIRGKEESMRVQRNRCLDSSVTATDVIYLTSPSLLSSL